MRGLIKVVLGTAMVLEKHYISAVRYAFPITCDYHLKCDFACQPCLLVKCQTRGTYILHSAPDIKERQ